jgi:urease accessory protein UreE
MNTNPKSVEEIAEELWSRFNKPMGVSIKAHIQNIADALRTERSRAESAEKLEWLAREKVKVLEANLQQLQAKNTALQVEVDDLKFKLSISKEALEDVVNYRVADEKFFEEGVRLGWWKKDDSIAKSFCWQLGNIHQKELAKQKEMVERFRSVIRRWLQRVDYDWDREFESALNDTKEVG